MAQPGSTALVLNYTPLAAAAVPEPVTAFGLAAAGLGAAVVLRRTIRCRAVRGVRGVVPGRTSAAGARPRACRPGD